MATNIQDRPNFLAPSKPDQPEWLNEAFRQIQVVIDFLLDNHEIPEFHAPPRQLRDGLLARADGTNWNPGSGRGLYYYDATLTTWVFIA